MQLVCICVTELYGKLPCDNQHTMLIYAYYYLIFYRTKAFPLKIHSVEGDERFFAIDD